VQLAAQQRCNKKKDHRRKNLMKNVFVTMTLAALLLTSGAHATDITIKWKGTGAALGKGYLPKVASDGLQNVAIIAETGTGFSAFEDELGTYNALSTPPSVKWFGSFSSLYSPPQTTPQVGHAPSIALALIAGAPSYNNSVEVHQGGQDAGSSLWFQLGSNNADSTAGINWSVSDLYDLGYNPTVAIDVNSPTPASPIVVAVHQAANSVSPLLYHVGTLTLGASPSMSSNWYTVFDVNSGLNQGKMPTVSVSNNLAVLVAEGDSGALWYSMGVVDTATNTINWGDAIPYSTTGYNPTISVSGAGTGFPGSRTVVEAHQSDNSTGPLTYRTGVLINGTLGAPPTSITWTPDTDNPYATGCNPSVAVAWWGYDASNLNVTEAHAASCGAVSAQSSSFGYLVK
jgi:hypothetical protein